MNHKAQITVYIIIGMTILLLLSVAIYLAQMWMPAEITPAEQSIKDYVESCIQQTGADALVSLGANGGYIEPLDIAKAGKEIKISLEPAEGDALLVSGAEHAIPYWFYMQTPNNCKQCALSSLQPSLDEIKKQMDDYVDEKLDGCINDFAPFIEQGYTFEAEKAKTDTIVTENDIRILVNYPVTINKDGSKTVIKEFEAGVDVPLKKIYALAGEITAQEKEKAFLESTMFHFVSLHTGLELSKLPPIAAITHDRTVAFWLKPMVAINLQQLLLSYIPLIQLDKTKGAKQITKGANPFESGFYKALYMKFLRESYPFKVSFSYLDWPLYFDITPSNGDTLTGETHIQEFPYNIAQAFQTNYYEFYYDISAPVLVEIRDSNALKGKGYSFDFALELNVRDNKNFIEWNLGEGTLGIWNPDNTDIVYEESEGTSGSCLAQGDMWKCDLTKKTYQKEIECIQACGTTRTTTKEYSAAKRLFNDEEQMISGNITVTVLDAATKQAVPGASIIYKCGRYATKIIGATDNAGKSKSKLPICLNGQLSAEKEGYAKKIIGLTITPDEGKDIAMNLEPEVEVNAVIKKYTVQMTNIRDADYALEPNAKVSSSYSNVENWKDFGFATLETLQDPASPVKPAVNWEESGHLVGREQKKMKIYDRSCCGLPEQLGAKQKAILLIEKIPEDELEQPYFATISTEGTSKEAVKLIPGQYKVTGMLMDSGGFVIQKGCQETCLEYDTSEWETFKKSNIDTLSLGMAPKQKPECKKWGYFPEENITAKPSLMGGVALDNSTGYWNVTRAELSKGSVEFYFIQTLKPTCTMVQDCVLDTCVDIAEIMATKPYSQQYREYVEPRFLVR